MEVQRDSLWGGMASTPLGLLASVAGSFVVGFVAMSASAAVDPTLVAPDPAVVFGTLPNGLRYAIDERPSHQTEAIEFFVAAGSLDEANGEEGVAHFLEHMAFNGSRSIPAGTLTKTFEAQGIAVGKDQNATTTFDGTDYTLNIANVNDQKIDLAFTWLGDVADGLSLAPEEVQRERGVVLSEYTLGLGPQKKVAEDFQRFLTPKLRVVDRPPIGRREVIEKADAATLRSFYQHWYRPENAILVFAGDEPAAAIKARIERTFASWSASAPSPPTPSFGSVDFQRAGETRSLAEPSAPTGVTVCRFTAKPPHRPEDVEVTRQRLADTIWELIFAKRMSRRAQEENAPFLAATGGYSIMARAVGQTCFAATAKLDDWRGALIGLAGEVRRLETFGVTLAEYDSVRTQIVAAFDQSIAAEASQPAGSVADSLLSNLIEGDTYDTVEDSRRVTLLALAKLDPKAIDASFAQHWTQASPALVAVLGPKSISSEDVNSALAIANSAPAPSAPAEIAKSVWHYGDALQPGKIISRQLFRDPSFQRVFFTNGVILNVKRTSFSKDTVDVRITFGSGQMEVPPGKLPALTLASGLITQGGYGKNDLNDVSQLCEGKQCAASLQADRDHFELTGSTRPADIGLELQILTGLLSDPGFRSSMALAVPTAVDFIYRQYKISPPLQAILARDTSLPAPHVFDLPPQAEMASLNADDFRAALRPSLERGLLEVTIVGDMDEEAIVARVAATLGALPRRDPSDHRRPDAVHLRFSETPPPPKTVLHEGPKEQAVVLLTWPLYAWTPQRTHESRVISLLARVMQDVATERLRQKFGKTYQPSVALALPRGGDQGSIVLSAQTTPDASDFLVSKAQAIAGELARGSITQAQLDRSRRPMLEDAVKVKTYNDWWLNVLDGSYRHPDQLEAARSWDADMESISVAEVRAEARRWLNERPYVDVSLPAAAAQATKLSTDRGSGTPSQQRKSVSGGV